jgi:hypothetical protein
MAIVGVASFLMSIDCPIGEVDYFVLDIDYANSLRVEVEGHVLITPDVHKSSIYSE